MESENNLSLGIDIGTTSVKVCVVRLNSEDVLAEYSSDSNASVPSESPAGDEQSVTKIFTCVETCIKKVDENLLARVSCIGVCGQMHGCVLWKSDRLPQVSVRGAIERFETSNLITWQDGRCTEEFLRNLPKTAQRTKISTGYGCASLAWLQKNRPQLLRQFDRAGTVMDLLVCTLSGSSNPVMSTHNANSWGYFDLHSNQWESDLLKKEGFPVEYLPPVVEPGVVVGWVAKTWQCVPKGTPVLVGMGDLQCSTLSVLPGPQDAVLNVSTSSQLAVVTDRAAASRSVGNCASLLQVPYFDGKHLIVAAALTGGNAMAHLVEQIQGWCSELGIGAPNEDRIYQNLFESASKIEVTSLSIDPLLWGERHLPSDRGVVSNLSMSNSSLGDITHAVCRGIVVNLKRMMPPEIFQLCEVTSIVGCGSGLQRNELLQKYIKLEFKLPLQLRDKPAAFGAALSANFKKCVS